jgi:DNA polymerase III alpha subunit (gram-positive type)
MFKNYKRLVIMDTETSGLSPDNGEILELGAVVLTRPEGEERFTEQEDISVLIKNDNPIPWNITQINHIDDKMCEKDGISKKEFYELLTTMFGHKDTLIIAYNTPFDMKFIKAFMKKMNNEYVVNNDTLDLLEIAKDRTHTFRGNKLCDMLVRYEITDEENSHRALSDVKATLKVMRAFWKEKNDIEKYIRRYNEGI